MLITSITVQKGNAKRYNIYVDGSFSFSADYEDVIELGIKENAILDYDTLKETIHKCQYKKAFNKTLWLLGVRQRSESELRKKLKDSNYDDTIIDDVLMKLKELNYVNDMEFSKLWIEDRMTLKPTGKRRLIKELSDKGVDSELIKDAIEESGSDDLKTAISLIEKKTRKVIIESLSNKDYQKIMRYLIYRGIDYEVARQAINIYFNSDV